MYTLKQSQKGNTFKRRAELEASAVCPHHQELAQSAVTQFAFGKQNRTVAQSCVTVDKHDSGPPLCQLHHPRKFPLPESSSRRA